MAVKLNRSALEHAESLIKRGRVAIDDRDAWSEHKPTAADENRFIDEYGWTEYGRWHLGVDDEAEYETKAHFKFPYGDFEKVHRCAILAAESRAGQYKYDDIEKAVAHLHGMLEAVAPR
jgi:hypothetical protein